MYALLVGINEYADPSIQKLGGCVHDVELMAELLREQFGVDSQNIRVLKNSDATYEAIKQSFQECLINHARASALEDKQSPFLFHFSGHGSQAPDETGSEPDGMDETIVPYDSRTADIEDIKDWELGLWLEELTGHCPNVSVVLDCCHSGSGTRGISDGNSQTRRCPADTRPQKRQRPDSLPGQRSIAGPSGWRHSGGYALLAGCRDHEESNEHMGWDGRTLGRHGALSYFLINQLANMKPDQALTYRELHRTVRQQVHDLYPEQTPCCEGDIDREVFGGLRPHRNVFIDVVTIGENTVSIAAGQIHGLTVGSLLRVYAPETRTVADTDAPLATLSVISTDTAQSECTILEVNVTIPLHAQAVVYQLAAGDKRFRVALNLATDAPRSAVQQRLGGVDIAGHIELINTSGDTADFTVQAATHGFSLLDADAKLLHQADSADALVAALMHLIRFRKLEHLAAPSQLAREANTHFEVKRLVVDGDKVTAQAFENDSDQPLVIDHKTKLVFEITNCSTQALYFAVLNLSSEWAVNMVYPLNSAREFLPAGKTFMLGLTAVKDDQLAPALPEGAFEAREIMMLIASSVDTDFEMLCQEKLEQGSDNELVANTEIELSEILNSNNQTRSAGAAKTVWSTKQICISVRDKTVS